MRLERFITKEQRRLTEESLRENLTLLSKQEFTRLASAAAKRLEGYTEQDGCPHYRGGACMIAALQKLSPATADDLLAVYRTARKNEVQEVLLYTAVPVGADAEAFIRRLSQVNIHVQPPEKLLALCKEETAVDTDSLVTQKLAEAEAEKKRKRAQPFASGQTRKYLFCTAVLAAASFLTHYPLYYRLLAGVSLALAGMSFFLNHPAKQKHAS